MSEAYNCLINLFFIHICSKTSNSQNSFGITKKTVFRLKIEEKRSEITESPSTQPSMGHIFIFLSAFLVITKLVTLYIESPLSIRYVCACKAMTHIIANTCCQT
jgi:hypothetical protein